MSKAFTRTTTTNIPPSERPPNPCEACERNEHDLCTGVGCYRCPVDHHTFGVIGGYISIIGQRDVMPRGR